MYRVWNTHIQSLLFYRANKQTIKLKLHFVQQYTTILQQIETSEVWAKFEF